MENIQKIKELLDTLISADLEIVLREVLFRYKRRIIKETIILSSDKYLKIIKSQKI